MSGKKTDNPHDTRMKELFHDKKAFMSLLKDLLKADWADDIDESSLKRSPNTYILPDFSDKEADVVYECRLKNSGEKVIFYVLLENQSRVDYRMPYRLLLYIVEVLRDYYNHADEKERKRKGFKFPAVIPLVFYTGRRKWTVPLTLRDMFAGQERFGDALIDFTYKFIDAKTPDDESLENIESKLLELMIRLERSQDFDEVMDTIGNYKAKIMELNDEEKRVLNVAFKIFSQVYGDVGGFDLSKILYAESKEVDGMLVDFRANTMKRERSIRAEGKAEGKKEEAVEIAKSLLDVLDVETIAKKTKLTVQEIEALNDEI